MNIEYEIEYAEQTARQNFMYIVRRPDINTAARRYRKITIPGRDGDLYIDEENCEDIEISIEFNFIGKPDRWFSLLRKAKQWLLKPGMHKLKLSDNQGWFFRVKKVKIETAARVCYEIGRFTAVFTCDGCEYKEEGAVEKNVGDAKYNPYDPCQPTYLITGNGTCTLTVNGKTMKATVGQNITIDTERMLAYRKDGTMMNTAVAGDYEDLYLQPGENDIKITSGFTLKVIPNWRCL